MLSVLILYMSGGIYNLKSTSTPDYFEKLFLAVLSTLSEFLSEIFLSAERNICLRSMLCSRCMIRGLNSGPLFNKLRSYPTRCPYNVLCATSGVIVDAVFYTPEGFYMSYTLITSLRNVRNSTSPDPFSILFTLLNNGKHLITQFTGINNVTFLPFLKI